RYLPTHRRCDPRGRAAGGAHGRAPRSQWRGTRGSASRREAAGGEVMSDQTILSPPIEAERYELQAEPVDALTVARREFLKMLGGGILVMISLHEAPAFQESGGGRRGGGRGRGAPVPQEVSAWLHVGEDGMVTAYTGKTEVGQNIRTSLSQAVADELRVPLA